jgi:hypothetical protein
VKVLILNDGNVVKAIRALDTMPLPDNASGSSAGSQRFKGAAYRARGARASPQREPISLRTARAAKSLVDFLY